ncbi:MAG: hypothetical protein H0W61_10925 [Bacteroidetes bacterium]|nr:hypothetical protein [Bacteroidota bacterium]
MKKLFLSLILTAFALNVYSQAQIQGEYHKYIVKKTDDERKKSKSKEWWGAGVILFSKQDIPREGKIKEVEGMLSNTFTADDKFVGRVYLPRAVNKMDAVPPQALIYRIYIDDASTPYQVGVRKDVMKEGGWSSWLLDFTDNFQTAMNSLTEGTHKVRVEIWSSREVDVKTVYVDENNKPIAFSKDTDNKGKFWASGDFTISK